MTLQIILLILNICNLKTSSMLCTANRLIAKAVDPLSSIGTHWLLSYITTYSQLIYMVRLHLTKTQLWYLFLSSVILGPTRFPGKGFMYKYNVYHQHTL